MEEEEDRKKRVHMLIILAPCSEERKENNALPIPRVQNAFPIMICMIPFKMNVPSLLFL